MTGLRVAGLFAGVGGIEKGLHNAGHTTKLLCEWDAAAQNVLREHFTNVEVVGDVRDLKSLPSVDLLAAGFPCTDISQAGRKTGIKGEQSGLVGEVWRLMDSASPSPEWLLLENVSYLLSLDRGNGLKHLIDSVEARGYRWAYRIVDARAFGLPQRRQRIVFLASRSNDPGAVLFADDAGPAAGFNDAVGDVDPSGAYGFYWTEGLRGLGWAYNAVPTIKGGSGLGIPSPPAIWYPNTGEFGTPQIPITIPTITASPRLINALFQGEKTSGGNIYNKAIQQDFVEPFDLKPTKKININVAAKTENIYTQNVVGVLEGADPVLKSEYVAIGAHYDHVGMNPFAAGDDKIWNGADDDGSGTVSVLSIAEAFAKGAQRPKRSILFIWHAGEEKGLWGSEYFTDHPTIPINQIITELNIDMIGRYQNPGDENHPINKQLPKQGEVFVIGSKMMSTDLGEISEATNKSFLNLNFNYKYDDPKDPEQFFYRSDHFNYARKGVPIIFYMDGVHADYHQPSDSIEKINFEQMEKVARTIFATAWELSNRVARPKVDKPLPVNGN